MGALVVACGSGDSGVGDAKLPAGVHSENVEHEACNESGNKVDVLDANGDGKPDIRRVYDKSNHEVCRIVDLNHDGSPDLYEYFDASGQVRRREADYDGSGVVDAIEYYEGGKLVRRELDTTGQHRIDTWDWFDPATGKHTRRERDTTNDGRVDQWWTWNGEQVTIAFDKNNDGKPDPEDTVKLGDAPSAPAAPTDAGTQYAAGGIDAGYVPLATDSLTTDAGASILDVDAGSGATAPKPAATTTTKSSTKGTKK
ncbi:MAG TPA: hypothetical protein VF407_11395 [Polyangiaceae bacterium]